VHISNHNNHHSTQGFRNNFKCNTKQILNLADGYSQRDEKQKIKNIFQPSSMPSV